MTKVLGPNFGNEVLAAGLGGLPFSWGPTSDDMLTVQLTPDQASALSVVVDAHDPSKAFVPQSVTPRQARLALLGAGLLAQVNSLIASAGGATQVTWDYASVIDRNDPLITQLSAGLSLTPAQIDALFVTGSTL